MLYSKRTFKKKKVQIIPLKNKYLCVCAYVLCVIVYFVWIATSSLFFNRLDSMEFQQKKKKKKRMAFHSTSKMEIMRPKWRNSSKHNQLFGLVNNQWLYSFGKKKFTEIMTHFHQFYFYCRQKIQSKIIEKF